MLAPPPPSSAGTPTSARPDSFKSAILSAMYSSLSPRASARRASSGPSLRAISTAPSGWCVVFMAADALMLVSLGVEAEALWMRDPFPKLGSTPVHEMDRADRSHRPKRGDWHRSMTDGRKGATVCVLAG